MKAQAGNKTLKGQASAELLTVIAIMAVFILPLLLFAYLNASSSGEKAILTQANLAASKMATTADAVGYLGSGSSMIAEIEMPQGISGISIRNSSISEIVFNISTSAGTNQLVYVSRFPISASTDDLQRLAGAGLHRVNISAGTPSISSKGASVTLKLA